MLRKYVRKIGDCAGIFNIVTGEIFMQFYENAEGGQKEDNRRTTISNAYKRIACRGTHNHRPAIDAYKKKFGVCDLFNHQIKHRIWPHKHGGRGTMDERGKLYSFAIGCILLWFIT